MRISCELILENNVEINSNTQLNVLALLHGLKLTNTFTLLNLLI